VQFAQVFRWAHGNAERRLEQRIKFLEPEHLGFENGAEVARDGMRDVLHRKRFAQFVGHRGHGFGRDAARNDEIEIIEIDVDVEGEAV